MEKIEIFESQKYKIDKVYDAWNRINNKIVIKQLDNLLNNNNKEQIIEISKLLKNNNIDLNYPKIKPIFLALSYINNLKNKQDILPNSEEIYFINIDYCSINRIIELLLYKLTEVLIESSVTNNRFLELNGSNCTLPLYLEIPMMENIDCGKFSNDILIKVKNRQISFYNKSDVIKNSQPSDQKFIAINNRLISFPFDDSILSRNIYSESPIVIPNQECLEKWKNNLLSSFGLLSEVYSNFEKLSNYVKSILPTYSVKNMITSSSCPEILGQVYLPYCNDIVSIAECYLHECMHQYFYRINYIDAIFTSGSNKPIYYSPWRDDPRPLSGVYHGAFVFAEVSKFYIKLRNHISEQSDECFYHSYLRINQSKIALNIISKYGNLSPLGESLLSEIYEEIYNYEKLIELKPNHKIEIDTLIDKHAKSFSHYKS